MATFNFQFHSNTHYSIPFQYDYIQIPSHLTNTLIALNFVYL